jgi:hypothetical protein
MMSMHDLPSREEEELLKLEVPPIEEALAEPKQIG